MEAFVSGILVDVCPSLLQRRRSTICMARAGRLRTAETNMDDFIDDFQRRKLGRGSSFYGRRKSGSEKKEVVVEEEDDLDTKENAVLVTGATGEAGAWIVVGLLNAGINVRVLTRRPDEAERMFGLDGTNIDVFVGNLNSDDDVKEAVDGAAAIVCASTGSSPFGRNSYEAIDNEGVRRLVQCAESSKIKRFVLLSCMKPPGLFGSQTKSKRSGEDALRSSNVPHFILRSGPMTNGRGSVRQIDLDPHDDASTTNTQGDISREDVALVITNFLLADALHLFGDPDNDILPTETSEFKSSFVVSAHNSKDAVTERNWPDLFKALSP